MSTALDNAAPAGDAAHLGGQHSFCANNLDDEVE